MIVSVNVLSDGARKEHLVIIVHRQGTVPFTEDDGETFEHKSYQTIIQECIDALNVDGFVQFLLLPTDSSVSAWNEIPKQNIKADLRELIERQMSDCGMKTSNFYVPMTENEAKFVRAMIQNPTVHPDEEPKDKKAIRATLFERLSNLIGDLQ